MDIRATSVTNTGFSHQIRHALLWLNIPQRQIRYVFKILLRYVNDKCLTRRTFENSIKESGRTFSQSWQQRGFVCFLSACIRMPPMFVFNATVTIHSHMQIRSEPFLIKIDMSWAVLGNTRTLRNTRSGGVLKQSTRMHACTYIFRKNVTNGYPCASIQKGVSDKL